jgi:predicted DNA-binding protein (UPF0251 family)/predicted Fe-Mo cluster-binding NifX family protein
MPARDLPRVILGFDEAEAVRLADLEGLYQEVAAMRMGVSRQTFGRIVESARYKIADAIINKKCIRIEGGEVTMTIQENTGLKVAIPVRDGHVDEHFGHCDHFMVYSFSEQRALVGETKVESPDGCGCKSGIATSLARMGVTHMVAGRMGDGAVRLLKANGIEVTRGASGDARKAAELYAAGRLADLGTPCPEHGSGHGHDRGCGHEN